MKTKTCLKHSKVAIATLLVGLSTALTACDNSTYPNPKSTPTPTPKLTPAPTIAPESK